MSGHQVFIDFSLFADDAGSVGVVSGTLELPVIPVVGDTILLFQGAGVEVVAATAKLRWLVVEHRMIGPANAQANLMISLSGIDAKTEVDALVIANYCESVLGLVFEPTRPPGPAEE
jgi:hypothetical protein